MTHSYGRTSHHEVVFYAPRISPLLNSNEDPAPGGAEVQVLLLARELAARGHRVALVVRQGEARLPSETGGITIISQPTLYSGPQILRSVRNAATTIRTLWPLDTTVFVQRAAGRETGLVALIAKARRRRFVYSSANVIDFAYHCLERRRSNVAFFHLGIKLADDVVVQTAEQEELCRSRFRRAPILVKSLAEPAEQRTAKPEAFLWVGRSVAYKQPLAYVELARRLPDALFWMVPTGKGEAAHQLRCAIDEARRGLDNLEVLGERSRHQLTRLIERAVALVNTADYEGMPNVFLEAWSRGVPALALSHDPDGVISREQLGGFAQNDSDRFVELAQQLWSGRYHQEDIALRCMRYTQREHSPKVIAARWAEALGLMNRSGLRRRETIRRDRAV